MTTTPKKTTTKKVSAKRSTSQKVIDRQVVLSEQIEANANVKMGRPTILCDEFKSIFLDYISAGLSVNKALAKMKKDKELSELDDSYFPYINQDVEIPERTTIFLWLNRDADFFNKYIHAKESCIEAWVDETIEIADHSYSDLIEKLDREGNPTGEMRVDFEAIQRSKLRVETRQYYIERLKPKRYGTLIKSQVDVDPDSVLGKTLFAQLSPVPVRKQQDKANDE